MMRLRKDDTNYIVPLLAGVVQTVFLGYFIGLMVQAPHWIGIVLIAACSYGALCWFNMAVQAIRNGHNH